MLLLVKDLGIHLTALELRSFLLIQMYLYHFPLPSNGLSLIQQLHILRVPSTSGAHLARGQGLLGMDAIQPHYDIGLWAQSSLGMHGSLDKGPGDWEAHFYSRLTE